MRGVMQWLMTVAGHPDIGSAAVEVALAIASYADAEGHAWPSQARLIEATCLSRRTLQRVIPELTASGLLDREDVHAGDELPSGYVARRNRPVYRLIKGANLTPKTPV